MLTKTVSTRTASTKMATAIGLGALAALAFTAAPPALAQTKVKYAEVVRSVFYLPKYVGLVQGFYKAEGLDIDMTTAQGGDRGTAMLLSGQVDIALLGPETPIYVHNGPSPEKVKIFSAVTATDGLFLMSREKMTMQSFKWEMMKGKEVFGWRPGSSPAMFFEHALKKHGLDPKTDFTHTTNIAIPARLGAWLAGRGQFGIFAEPEVVRLEREGAGSVVASIGKEVGQIDYTVFLATDAYIKKNPQIIQAWANGTQKALDFVAKGDPEAMAKSVSTYFPEVPAGDIAKAIERYRSLGIWKMDGITSAKALNDFQTLMIEAGLMKDSERVAHDKIVLTSFAEKAKAR
ncbi:MAG: ABC transporter substrate-binding protein [Alphaproteobacteria bacterium]|nr:ABC transporter substrate-binding protein [Alphaproteobacteria bacterium]